MYQLIYIILVTVSRKSSPGPSPDCSSNRIYVMLGAKLLAKDHLDLVDLPVALNGNRIPFKPAAVHA